MTAPELKRLVAEAKAAGEHTVVMTVPGHFFLETCDVMPGVRGRVRRRRFDHTEVEVWVSSLDRVIEILENPNVD